MSMEYRVQSTGQHGITMKILLAALLLLLSACATTPPTSASSIDTGRVLAFQQPGLSTIVVTRDVGIINSGCYLALRINGTLAARFDTGETARFFVAPGEVLFQAGRDPQGKGLCGMNQDMWKQRETVLHSGETKHFRITSDTNGYVDIERGE
jgi:hypothetical protein